MPLFMDVHDHVEGLTADAVAGAHKRDLEVQDRYKVKGDRRRPLHQQEDGERPRLQLPA